MRKIILFVICYLVPHMLMAQGSLTVYNLDASQFPILKADCFAFDAGGNLLKNLSAGDFAITENGITRIVQSVSCPPDEPPKALSVVLTIDISGSMGGGTSSGTRIDVAKSAAVSFVNALPLGNSECAVTSFDGSGYINQDFTTDRQRLLNAIAPLRANGGTNYDAGLLNPPAGAIEIAKAGKHKRVIIFLTDGSGGGTESAIIQSAQQNNVEIYVIGLNFFLPEMLKNVAQSTGGQWFESVRDEAAAKAVYNRILAIAQGGKACRISWMSEVDCFKNRSVIVSIPQENLSQNLRYVAPEERLVRLDVQPVGIELGGITPLTFKDTSIIITAENGNIQISDIRFDNPLFTITSTPVNFLLKEGESRQITIRFQPVDSVITIGEITFKNDACSARNSFVRGGYEGKTRGDLLKVVFPNGKERFLPNADTVITWTGVLPQDTVRLEYSLDGGTSWVLISNFATGLRHSWKVPSTASKSCLVRAQTKALGPGVPGAKWQKVFTIEHDGLVDRLRLSPDGSDVLVLDRKGGINAYSTSFKKKYFSGGSTDATAIGYSRTTDFYTISRDSTAALFELGKGSSFKVINTSKYPELAGKTLWGVDVSSDTIVAVGTNDGEIAFFKPAPLFSSQEPKFLGKITTGYKNRIIALKFTADGKRIACSFTMNQNSTKVYQVNFSPGFSSTEIWASLSSWQPFSFYGSDISPDGRYLAILENLNDTLQHIILDINERKIVRNLRSAFTNGLINGSFSEDSKYYISADCSLGQDGRFLPSSAHIYNILSGELEARLEGHPRLVLDAAMNAEQNIAVTGGHDSVVNVWKKIVSPQSDISDTLFTILGPQAAARDIDFGLTLVNSTKDSLFKTFICNTSDVAFTVDSISILADADAGFAVVSGIPAEIAPNSCHEVEFRFAPNRDDLFLGTARIFTNFATLEQKIQGRGIDLGLEVTELVDFGQITIGSLKDSTVEFTITNTGSGFIKVLKTELSGPDTAQFSIIDGGGEFTLNSGDSRTMKLRFQPEFTGRTSAAILFEFTNEGIAADWPPAIVQLFGEGLCGASAGGGATRVFLAENKITTKSGQVLKLPLKLILPNNNSIQSLPRAYSCDIRFKNSMLYPALKTPKGVLEGTDRVIHLEGKRSDTSNILSELVLKVMFGDTDHVAVKIENFKWNDCDVQMEPIDAEIFVSDICITDGKARYFKDTKATAMMVLKNTIEEQTEVQYRLAETGETEILLVDILGQNVGTVFKGIGEIGEYSAPLDFKNLGAGTYFLVLKTRTQVITERVEKLR
ncbi:MAG: choice-of-anchor D domain-containing protein [Bacteroidota bacterium]